MRLIDHLRGLGMSNRDARRALQTGKVWLQDTPIADPSRDIEPEQLRIRDNAPRIRVGVDPAIVFRDDHLAVVIKPSGLLSVPARGRRNDPTLIGEMSRAMGGVYAVHRLDEPTSGLMLVARTEASQAALKQLFFDHAIERGYRALVTGVFPDQPLTVDNLLVRDRGDGLRGSSEPGGEQEAKPAITHLRLVEGVGRHHSLVEARLETGRTHQVRIHLSELSHPVVGDRIYGQGRGRSFARLALHAFRLGFRHPFTGRQHSFEAPLTDDLERLLRDLQGQRSDGPRRPRRRRS